MTAKDDREHEIVNPPLSAGRATTRPLGPFRAPDIDARRVIDGGSSLREWVDDPAATPQDLDALALPDEQAWLSERRAYLRY